MKESERIQEKFDGVNTQVFDLREKENEFLRKIVDFLDIPTGEVMALYKCSQCGNAYIKSFSELVHKVNCQWCGNDTYELVFCVTENFLIISPDNKIIEAFAESDYLI